MARRYMVPPVVLVIMAGCRAEAKPVREPPPLDPQVVQDQDDMTWADYHAIPGHAWADRSLMPERGFRIALVAIDFPDQPFVITRPKHSDPFGNPQVEPIARDEVARFYADFFLEPGELNHGQTINGYWMEQSRGRFGITTVDAYGPYRMPRPLWAYGLNEYGQKESTPDGSVANARMEPDADSLWRAQSGDAGDRYDAILRIYAGYDETSVWQEFGEMKFDSPEDIPAEWGNPNPAMPRFVPTRYVAWTSWLAGAQQWGLSSIRQGESSGTITHELGHHAFRIPDLNNNPYVRPYRRVAAGPWDMMDRGSFNGPGGPHMRWVVPPMQGAAMPAGLMLRNRLDVGFVDSTQVVMLSRRALARTGPAVARVTARAVEPLPGTFAGLLVRLDGDSPHDRTPPSDPAVDPLSTGTVDYDFYTLEVVQRIGYDSFTPDNGVLIAKNRDSRRGGNGGPNEFNSFIRVIDAHPEDMNRTDYVRPNGERVMRTIADYRQLNDALFHAGLDSGSEFEWVDEPNRLQFYVIDLERSADGIRSYTVGVRSLDGAGPLPRGVAVEGPADTSLEGNESAVTFTIRNTTRAAAAGSTGERGGPGEAGEANGAGSDVRNRGVNDVVAFDIYRLSVTTDGDGWTAKLLNALIAIPAGGARPVTVYVSARPGAVATGTIRLTATSESDPSATMRAAVRVTR